MEDQENKDQKKGPSILIEYKLGTEKDWEIHFKLST